MENRKRAGAYRENYLHHWPGFLVDLWYKYRALQKTPQYDVGNHLDPHSSVVDVFQPFGDTWAVAKPL